MNAKIISDGLLRALGTVLLVGISMYFLYQIMSVLVYIIISLLLCLIASPLMRFLKERLRFKDSSISVTVVGMFLMLMIGFALLFVPLIASQASKLSLLDTNRLKTNVELIGNDIKTYLQDHDINITDLAKEANLSSKIDFNFFSDFINTIINFLLSFSMGLVSVVFITYFFIKDSASFKDKVNRMLPSRGRDKILTSIDKVNTMLSRYFVGLSLQILVVFVLAFIVLKIAGNDQAFVIAFLCAILNIIPYIGFIIGIILSVLLTMISNIGKDFQTEILPPTIYVVIGFFLIQLIDNFISQPLISSKSVKSHPLEVFLVILISGILFGIVGMIIAIPIVTIVKVVTKEFFPKNKVISVLTEDI